MKVSPQIYSFINKLGSNFGEITVQDLHNYITSINGFNDKRIHRQIIQKLFRETYLECKKLVQKNKIVHRDEIAILLNPPSFARSPHTEMALSFHNLAKSIDIPVNIYISNLPSLGNIYRYQDEYSYKSWEINELNLQLTSLIHHLSQDKTKIPKIQSLHDQCLGSTKLIDIIGQSINNLTVGDSFPYYSMGFSGGGANFLGGWGLEWLDPIGIASKHTSLALMGWYDIPINSSFYSRYIGPEQHPLKKHEIINKNFYSFSLIEEQKDFKSFVPENEIEEHLQTTIEHKMNNSPILIFASNDLYKRSSAKDFATLIRLKIAIPNLKILVIGRNSNIFRDVILGIKYNNQENTLELTSTHKNLIFKAAIEFKKAINFKPILYSKDCIFNFESFENFEKSLAFINKLRSKIKHPTLFTHVHDSGNGISNTIASYSGLTSLFNVPNDSSRALPKIFFAKDYKNYFYMTLQLLSSYNSYNKFRKIQAISLKNHVNNYNPCNDNQDFLH